MMKFASGLIFAVLVATVSAQEKAAPPPLPPVVSAETARRTNAAATLLNRSGQEFSAEQRRKLEEINKNFNDAAAPLYARLSTAKRELESLISQDKTDEAAVRAKTKEMADLEADIALARARRYTQFRAFLPPDQARRFNQTVPMNRSFQPALREGQAPPPNSPVK
jgi:Spy/CpxP family protein refolding chaperone